MGSTVDYKPPVAEVEEVVEEATEGTEPENCFTEGKRPSGHPVIPLYGQEQPEGLQSTSCDCQPQPSGPLNWQRPRIDRLPQTPTVSRGHTPTLTGSQQQTSHPHGVSIDSHPQTYASSLGSPLKTYTTHSGANPNP